jgi:peptide/histidine transporter 3/4
MANVEEKGLENGGLLDYTQDGTTDLKGRPISRSKTGRWRACSFIVGKYLISSLLFELEQ